MILSGKTAVVTGAGQGLGRALAVELAKMGASVSLFSRTFEELKAVEKEIEANGGNALAVAGDVSHRHQVRNLLDKTLETFGNIDILVNNAAITGPPRFLDDFDTLNWETTLQIDLHGVFLCCRHILPVMAKNKAGKIINITSGLAGSRFPRFCAYSVAKAGVNQLTLSLSKEFEKFDIRINAVDPGIMDTNMQLHIRSIKEEHIGSEVKEQFMTFKQKGELADPLDVAKTISILTTPAADHINGQILSLEDLRKIRIL